MYALILIVSIVAAFGDGGAHVQIHHVDYYASYKTCDYAGSKAVKQGSIKSDRGLYKVDYTCVPTRKAVPIGR